MNYYAIRKGRRTGVFFTESTLSKLTKDFPNAEYKSFNTYTKAAEWVWGPQDLEKPSDNLHNPKVRVYIDGSTIGNGKVGSKGGYGVFYANGDPRNVSKTLKGEATNNRAELSALINVLENNKDSELLIITDSVYNINCYNGVKNWKKNGWKLSSGSTPKNIDLLKILHDLLKNRNWKGVVLQKVDAHKRPPKKDSKEYQDWYGNFMADKLSKDASK